MYNYIIVHTKQAAAEQSTFWFFSVVMLTTRTVASCIVLKCVVHRHKEEQEEDIMFRHLLLLLVYVHAIRALVPMSKGLMRARSHHFMHRHPSMSRANTPPSYSNSSPAWQRSMGQIVSKALIAASIFMTPGMCISGS